ncbi:hypothetical protein LTR56_006245 [Elasticomyces elasticus]|nr:hypothetical protein LTR56_006245 [Elasticomyces elasticus]KAK3666546.1 hypothetical protein LTR22_002490 [Elasticomyces elasticus]KAK4928321.1 hypothetical protein LTR49_004998 [Elasticomyces elasticus]KAK5763884.1 hypothetical protein LTS12_006002 [Elasticomyces elasticus]
MASTIHANDQPPPYGVEHTNGRAVILTMSYYEPRPCHINNRTEFNESFSGPIIRQVNDAVIIPNEMTFQELRDLLASRQIVHFETEIGPGPKSFYTTIGMCAHGKLIHIIDDVCWHAVKALLRDDTVLQLRFAVVA